MRYLVLTFFLFTYILNAQIDVNSTLGLPRVTDADGNGIDNEIINETVANEGNLIYNTTDQLIYRYNGTTWLPLTDDQNASEVPLVTNIDLNGVPTDPSPVIETNVEEALQAIAPITSKAGRVFYPPSIEIDASTISSVDQQINLHSQYLNQYDITATNTTVVIGGATVNYQTAKSTSAPDNIPTYAPEDLYYYVTFADSSIFNIISLSDTGILTYRIVGIPSDFNTIINVVFVVK